MTKIVYRIVEHDGGWAYQLEGVFSETFPSHEAERRAAQHAAAEQHQLGDTRAISWEDSKANGTRKSRAATIGLRPKSRVDNDTIGGTFQMQERTQ